MKTIVLGYDDSESAMRALVSASPSSPRRSTPRGRGDQRSSRPGACRTRDRPHRSRSIRPSCIESSSVTRRPYSTSWASKRSTTSASATPPT